MKPLFEPQKTWKNTSPSQISTFRLCPRKWWLQKIYGLSRAPHPSALLGTKKHAILEAYFRREEPLITDPMLTPGLKYLPSPLDISPAGVEMRINFDAEDVPVPFLGVIDLVEHKTGTITDHKTTSNFRYTKTPEQLQHDPQAIIYTRFAWTFITEFQPLETVRFRHVYYRTKGAPASKESVHVFTRDQIKEGWQGIVETSAKMHDCATKPGEDVPYNLDACGAYGGCPFKVQCANMGADTLGALGKLLSANPLTQRPQPEDKMNAFKRRLLERQAKELGKPQPPAEEPMEAPTPFHSWFKAKGHQTPPEVFTDHNHALAWSKPLIASEETMKAAYRRCYEKATQDNGGKLPTMEALSTAWIKAVREYLIGNPTAPEGNPTAPEGNTGAPVPPPARFKAPGAQDVNPPGGARDTDMPPPPQPKAAKKTSGDAPFMPDGTSARKLRKAPLFAAVTDHLEKLDEVNRARLAAEVPEALRPFVTHHDAKQVRRMDVINDLIPRLTCLVTAGKLHTEHSHLLNAYVPTPEPEDDGDKREAVSDWIQANRENQDIDNRMMALVMDLAYDIDDQETAAMVISLLESKPKDLVSAQIKEENEKLRGELSKAKTSDNSATLLRQIAELEAEAERLHREKDAMVTAGGEIRRTLYIGCRPMNGDQATHWTDFVQPFCEQVCAAEAAPNWHLIPYNKGPAKVAAVIEAQAGRASFPQRLYLEHTAPMPILEILIKLYDDIVKAG